MVRLGAVNSIAHSVEEKSYSFRGVDNKMVRVENFITLNWDNKIFELYDVTVFKFCADSGNRRRRW